VRNLVIAVVVSLLALSACSTTPGATPVRSFAAAACAQPLVKHPGRLTLSTDSPALAPWWGGDPTTQYLVEPSGGSDWQGGDPYGMEGYESGVSYSLANNLGFEPDQLDWVKSDATTLASGPKPYDFYIAHVPLSAARAQNVDFSQPYFESPLAVVALAADDINGAKSVADLKQFKLGALAGSSGAEAIGQVVQPQTVAATYADRAAAVAALQSGEIDGFVTEMNSAFYLRDGWHEDSTKPLVNSTIVGRFADSMWTDKFALVLEKGSPLLACVNEAIDQTREQNFFEEYRGEYIVDDKDVPTFS
jgi:polar amino acid transport system substrate-binding protein